MELHKRFVHLFIAHREIIIQLGSNSGHIGNPFFLLFYPRRSEFPTPFHLIWPRINNQKTLDPVWDVNALGCVRFWNKNVRT